MSSLPRASESPSLRAIRDVLSTVFAEMLLSGTLRSFGQLYNAYLLVQVNPDFVQNFSQYSITFFALSNTLA